MADETTTTETETTTEDTARPEETPAPKDSAPDASKDAQEPVKADAPTVAGDASTAKAVDASGSPAKAPLSDIDERLVRVEAALAAERAAKKSPPPKVEEKPPESAKEPTATEVRAAMELLKEGPGKRADAVLRWLEENGVPVDDDILLELAPKLEGKTRKEPTVEERIAAEIDRREAKREAERLAKEAEAETKRKADEDREQETAREEVNTYLKRGAEAAKTAIAEGKYPFLADYGIDASRVQTLLFELIEKNKTVPDHAVIFDLMEAESEERWNKSRFSPKKKIEVVEEDPDEIIRRSFLENAAKYASENPEPIEDDDDVRAALIREDREARNKRDWRR